jgi:hypothetical protein
VRNGFVGRLPSAHQLVQERFWCCEGRSVVQLAQLGDHDVARRENFGSRVLLAEEVDDPEELHRLRAEALVAWLHSLETVDGCLEGCALEEILEERTSGEQVRLEAPDR